MSDFQPGVARMAQQGHKVVRRPYAAGEAGYQTSMQEIGRRILEARNDGDVRDWAGEVLMKAGRPQAVRAQFQAILDAFGAQTIYAPDPWNTEMINSAAATLCLRPGLCVRARDCIPEGTLLLRDDLQLIPIEQIQKGERIWGRDGWTPVKATWFVGARQVDAIEMSNGSTAYLTKNHKIYVGRCRHGRGVECPTCTCASRRQDTFIRVRVSDLREGEALLRPECISYGTRSEDVERTYVEGLALADGWVEKRYRREFYVAGRDGKRKEKQKHEVKAICDRLGIETRWHARYIAVKDPVWARRIYALGERARFKHLASINLDESTAAAALRGLMADSTANSQGGGRTYSTTSYKMLVQVRLLHKMQGASTSIKRLTPAQHRGAGKHPLWRLCVAGVRPYALSVRSVERAVKKVPCWDITTEDHYVYLPEHDVTVSNCDDGVVTVGGALAALGYPVQVIKQVWAGQQPHVLVAVEDESGNWLTGDPSLDHARVGFKAHADSEEWMDPFQGASPELVGFGNRPWIVSPTGLGKQTLGPRGVTLPELLARGLGAGGIITVTPDEVTNRSRDLNALIEAINNDLKACKALSADDPSYQAWLGFRNTWYTWYSTTEASWLNRPYDRWIELDGYAQQVYDWQKKFQPTCALSVPIEPPRNKPPLPFTDGSAANKTADALTKVLVAGTVLATVVGGVYVITLLAPMIRAAAVAAPKRKASEARRPRRRRY